MQSLLIYIYLIIPEFAFPTKCSADHSTVTHSDFDFFCFSQVCPVYFLTLFLLFYCWKYDDFVLCIDDIL